MARDDVEFAVARDGGRVHVLRPDDAGTTAHRGFAAGLMAWFEGGFTIGTSLCGVRIQLPHGHAQGTFHDDDLCVRCAMIFPEPERSRLFEHPTPDDDR